MNILVLDDQDKVLETLKLALALHGWQCSVANSYDEAQNLTTISKYDLIIVDYKLGEKKTGGDFIRYYKEKNPNIAVVMITAYQSELSYEESKLADKILEKPFDHRELINWIKETQMSGEIWAKYDKILDSLKMNQDHMLSEINEVKEAVSGMREGFFGKEEDPTSGYIFKCEKRFNDAESKIKSHDKTFKWIYAAIPTVGASVVWLLSNMDKIAKIFGG